MNQLLRLHVLDTGAYEPMALGIVIKRKYYWFFYSSMKLLDGD